MNFKWIGLQKKIKDLWLIRYLSDWFNPHKSFLSLPAFGVPFTVIVAVFILLCWKVIIDEGLVWGLPDKVDNWYDWFKVPFWVLALLIPVIGLFNANHKSEQAKAAMELTRSQNNFANYYKHLEEFQKYLVISESSQIVKFDMINKRRMHNQLFPRARNGIHELRKHMLDSFCDSLSLYAQIMIRIWRGDGMGFPQFSGYI